MLCYIYFVIIINVLKLKMLCMKHIILFATLFKYIKSIKFI